jgi:dihydrofolate reductase
MSTIVVSEFMTVDGVIQAPGAPKEDMDGGFQHGGWQVPYLDAVALEIIAGWMATADAMLLGRRTYEIFAAYWPHVGEDRADAAKLNSIPKYVASRTLTSVDWQNSTLLGPDVPAAVSRLREAAGGEIHVAGSQNLIQTLLRHDLVDEFRLMVHPVVLGAGKRLFGDGAVPVAFELVESRSTPHGSVGQVYRRAGAVGYGAIELAD